MANLADGSPVEVLELGSVEDHPLAAEEWLASRILVCLADPRAVCRLALVNKNFSAASISDLVWLRLLPPSLILDPLLPHLDHQPPSKKLLFIHLCKSVTYGNGLKKFWLDPNSGGECHMISARALSVIWGDTPQYWQWESYPGSMFAEVASLQRVCWFHVSGAFQNNFRPGRYIISCRLQLHSYQGWHGVPVKMIVQNMTQAHPPQESQVRFDDVSTFKVRPCFLLSKAGPSCEGRGSAEAKNSHLTDSEDEASIEESGVSDARIWVECDVGEFVVDEDNDNRPIEVNFTMKETDVGRWKTGLFLDGIIIRSSYVVHNIDAAARERRGEI